MNKSDCENIALILSYYVNREISRDELIQDIISMDNRIGEDFEMFGDCRDHDEKVMEQFNKLMEEKFGHNWPFHKDSSKITKKIMRQAEKEMRAD